MSQYIKDNAVETWSPIPKVNCYVLFGHNSHYCGYVELPNCPFKEPSYNGFLTYIPVHGGITYAEPPMYGFDCAHAQDQESGVWTLPRVIEETNLLGQCLCLAADGWEHNYLSAETDKQRAEVIDAFHKRLRDAGVADFTLQDNFGAMLNVLFRGKL